MLRLIQKVPRKAVVACSGGPDSMAVLDFLSKSKRSISACYFDHGTDHSHDAKSTVERYCRDNGIHLLMGSCQRDRLPRESMEEYWRNERMKFFHSIDSDVVTGHTLDDVCEWWLFTSLHGSPRIMPTKNKNISRPFLLTTKLSLREWCDKKHVDYVDDPTNSSDKFMRSYIRHNMLPQALSVNPGFYKVIRKKLLLGAAGK